MKWEIPKLMRLTQGAVVSGGCCGGNGIHRVSCCSGTYWK